MLAIVHALVVCGGITIDEIAKAGAYYFNTSVSLAITLPDGTTVAAAAGWNDRARGTLINTSSLIPGGSTNKFLTALGSMRLAEAGKLQLDAPIAPLVDPWLKSQGVPSLAELWNGDQTISNVTPRQLLSMRGGIRDYDDSKLRRWTVENPSKDWLPLDFVHNVSKSFLFPPDTGGAYSGVSYILMGWVLCAATNCADWTDLAQKELIEGGTGFRFDSTIFMTTGPCHQYDVVHQYMLYGGGGHAKDRAGRTPYPLPSRSERSLLQRLLRERRLVGDADAGPTMAAAAAALAGGRSLPAMMNPMRHAPGGSTRSPRGAARAHCTDHTKGNPYWYANARLNGTVLSSRKVASGGATACCGLGDTIKGRPAYWMFVDDGAGAGTCYFYSELVAYGGYSPTATAGRTDGPLSADDFVDLYDASCLNGWTMGNVATTPSDLTRVYQAAFTGGIVSPTSLKQMTTWNALTTGFATGAYYGLGLFANPIKIPLVRGADCTGHGETCKCVPLVGCHYEDVQVGHPGLDYGSGFPSILGYYPGLNASLAAGYNNGEEPMGMNFTMGRLENMELTDFVNCRLIDAAVHLAKPNYPALACGD